VRRFLRCPSKRGINSFCCSRAFSACWVKEVSAQYLISIRCISRLFGCMPLGFIARGYGLAGPSARLSQVNPLAYIGRPSWTRVCWVSFDAILMWMS